MKQNYLLEYAESVYAIQENSDLNYITDYILECGGVLSESQAIEAYEFLTEKLFADASLIRRNYRTSVKAAEKGAAAEIKVIKSNPTLSAEKKALQIKGVEISLKNTKSRLKDNYNKGIKGLSGRGNKLKGIIGNASDSVATAVKDAPKKIKNAKDDAVSKFKDTKFGTRASEKYGTLKGKMTPERVAKLKKGGKYGAAAAAAAAGAAAGYGVYRYASKRKSEK